MNSSFYYHVVYQKIKKEEILILRDQSTYKINDLKIVDIENFSNFFEKYFLKLSFFKKNSSFLICTGCGTLNALENHYLDDETIDYLNQNGLEIYLYEDLYVNYGPKIKNFLEGPPVDEKNKEKYYKIFGTSIRGFETNEITLKTMYAFELESIKTFIKNNKLKNVIVYCGDYNADRYFQKKYPMMKIHVRNICMTRFFKNLSDQSPIQSNVKTLNYRFISLNNSYKAHRHLIVSYLLDKNSLLSFDIRKAVYGDLKNHLWFDLNNWRKTEPKIFSKIQDNLIKLNDLKKLTLDQDEIPDSNFNDDFNYAPSDEFSKSFCAVITETKFSHPVSTFSEKTLYAISRFRPFILVAPPHTLEYLKTYGFKTFGDYWDESYDLEENHEKRLIKIFKVIDYIDSLPMTTLKNMYTNMKSLLEYNYNVIKETVEKNEF